MGRKLTGNSNTSSVLVQIKEKEGVTFVGKLLDMGKEVKLKRGKTMVFTFQAEDGTANYVKKDEKGNYAPAEVKEGEEVSLFAPTVLTKALLKSSVGKRIKITYLGLVQPDSGGSEYHSFDVEEI
jgi:hypothetical protein